MMAKGPVQNGDGKIGRPQGGKNGPSGTGGGTKHYAPPMPKSTKNGVQPGTKSK